MTDLIDTTEMYLRTIFELEEEGIVALRARIAERLNQSGPTVSQTVARMERAGLLVVSGDRHLELTDEGRTKATRVMRKHRLAERLLIDVIGLEWKYVHDEACRWEHVMSERVERKLLEILHHPTLSPYGNPIPGLAELGVEGDGEQFRSGLCRLSDLAGPSSSEMVVRRIGEPAQADPEVLAELESAGLRPGQRVWARSGAGAVIISGAVSSGGAASNSAVSSGDAGEDEVSVSTEVADHVFVAAVLPAVPVDELRVV